ncbi:glutamate formimidoyltransferase [candidate division KSB1 bacterium]|nr:glutamate formimidoyltransferase [candidate division KSB1 bacterium]
MNFLSGFDAESFAFFKRLPKLLNIGTIDTICNYFLDLQPLFQLIKRSGFCILGHANLLPDFNMIQLLECVPNFSEGRDHNKIDKISQVITSTPGVRLLDVDIGYDANRTVMTMIGDPESVLQAAFRAIAQAAELIDMAIHKGAHPRLGATDVCPFVPLRGVDMKQCIALAQELGERVGDELGIPVYLYEEAATRQQTKYLSDIRRGEYEGLAEKMQQDLWIPDYGPKKVNKKSGATVIGVRNLLIAFNVNINSTDKKIADDIAGRIRESGYLERDAAGMLVRDHSGKPKRTAGRFKGARAIGWYMPSFQRAQVSMNLVDYEHAPPHLIFDACCELAAKHGVRVTGSQLVGMVPLRAVLMAGRYYLRKQGETPAVPDDELIHMAVISMGLDDLAPIDIKSKILDYQTGRKELYNALSVKAFVDKISSQTPVPAGGSVSALCGALGSALTAMIAAITCKAHNKEKDQEMLIEIGDRALSLKKQFLKDIDRDAVGYEQYLKAVTARKIRPDIRQQSLNDIEIEPIMRVPVSILKNAKPVAVLARQMVIYGGRRMVSDAGTAALLAGTCAESAFLTIEQNLKLVMESDEKTEFSTQISEIKDDVCKHVEETLNRIKSRK